MVLYVFLRINKNKFLHRNFETTLDVSADLLELGKSNVAVVCSGIKSILDIPRTLEMLETQGVFVASYQCDDREFPAFYTRKSGVKAPYNVKDSIDVAKIIKINNDLELNSGILIGVPIPENYAMEGKLKFLVLFKFKIKTKSKSNELKLIKIYEIF